MSPLPVQPAAAARPGSAGEHELQCALGTGARAGAFYDHQVLDHLNDRMRRFVEERELVFVATADAHGEADCSLRAGPPGFITVLDPHSLLYPEYRGNGVMASLGNLRENGHVGLLFVDFVEATIGLHVNGRARALEVDEVRARPGVPETALADPRFGRVHAAERFVLVEVEEAYIHCSKHLPRFQPVPKERDWGTDDPVRKGGDHFAAKHEDRPWAPRAGGS